jgi:hypothetical protein
MAAWVGSWGLRLSGENREARCMRGGLARTQEPEGTRQARTQTGPRRAGHLPPPRPRPGARPNPWTQVPRRQVPGPRRQVLGLCGAQSGGKAGGGGRRGVGWGLRGRRRRGWRGVDSSRIGPWIGVTVRHTQSQAARVCVQAAARASAAMAERAAPAPSRRLTAVRSSAAPSPTASVSEWPSLVTVCFCLRAPSLIEAWLAELEGGSLPWRRWPNQPG